MTSQATDHSPSGDKGTAVLDDPALLERVYADSYPVVRGYVLANSGTDEEAKDVFQEAIVAAWKNQRAGRFVQIETSSVGAYVFTIAKRKWMDRLRSSSKKHTLRLAHDEVEEKTADADAQHLDIDYLNGLYARLDEKCQLLLKKFYFQRHSLREISADLNVTEESARTLKYRCVMKLRKMHLAIQNTDDTP